MDSSTSALIKEKALAYGLHSCFYCQQVIIDLTDRTLAGTCIDGSDNKKTLHVDDTPRVMYDKRVSRDPFINAASSCPLFATGDGRSLPDCNIVIVTQPLKCLRIEKSFTKELRLSRDIQSLISDPGAAGYLIHPCINSDKTFSRARQLLRQCLSGHDNCKQSGTPPSRLLDVSVNILRLVDTASINNPTWAALSYCWGGPQDAQTTNLNILDRYQRIELGSLPLTIRDAVHVCREMRIPYLWVDSLCIIQSSDTDAQDGVNSDKSRELRKMAGIYRGAVLTIAASCAASSTEGFLQDRKPYKPAMALPVRVGSTYDIAQMAPEPFLDTDRRVSEPIDSRAWTFQEQFLSCRILSFTTHAMEWHCPWMDWCISQEEEYDGYRSFDFLKGARKHDWSSVVHDYSQRDLSNLEDRPIAIAAVAECFAAGNPSLGASDYMAGLWKPDLPVSLLWSILDDKKDACRLKGPSWSWTSTSRPINTKKWKEERFNPTCTVISIEVDLADPELPFGPAKSGRIRLRGLISCRPVSPDDRPWPFFPHGFYTRVKFDRTPVSDVFLFELGSDGFHNHGLALEQTGSPGQFFRVGTYTEVAEEAYIDKEETIITII